MTNLDKIKNIVHTLNSMNCKDLFIGLLLNEVIVYAQDIEDITQDDISVLEQVYDKFIESDTITSLFNQDILDILLEITKESDK